MHKTVREAVYAAGRRTVVYPLMERDTYDFLRHRLNNVGIKSNIHIQGPPGHLPDYEVWNITSDNSIETQTSSMDDSPKNNRLCRVGIELISPIFRYNDPNWPSQIVTVFRSLNFLHLKANRSTGLHVHIGRESGSFELSEVKKIAKYVLVFESKISYYLF